MISKKLILSVEKFVYQEVEKYAVPSAFQIDLAVKEGLLLAKKFQADQNIVHLGLLLMDCMLGKALYLGKTSEHILMSAKKAKSILSKNSEITKEEIVNIINCVSQHHGVKTFYSLEAEICCNADCYRFASIKGVIGGIMNTRAMGINDLINLYSAKADEKWHALSLDICKKELKPQYQAIKTLLANYK